MQTAMRLFFAAFVASQACDVPANWPNTAGGDDLSAYFSCLSSGCHDADPRVFDGSGDFGCSDVVGSGGMPCDSQVPDTQYTVSDLCPQQCSRSCAATTPAPAPAPAPADPAAAVPAAAPSTGAPTGHTTMTATTTTLDFSDVWHGHHLYVKGGGQCYQIIIGVEVNQVAEYNGECNADMFYHHRRNSCGHYLSTVSTGCGWTPVQQCAEYFSGGTGCGWSGPRTSTVSFNLPDSANLSFVHGEVIENPTCNYHFYITDQPDINLDGEVTMSKMGMLFLAGVASAAVFAIAMSVGFANRRVVDTTPLLA